MAVIDYFKSSNLKQHEFIIYCSEGQKSEMGLTGLKSGVGRLSYLRRLQGRICFFTFSSFQRYLLSLACGPSFPYLYLYHSPCFQHCNLFLTLTLLPPSFPYKGPCDLTGPTCIIQDDFLMSRSLIIPTKCLLPCASDATSSED